jgi:hypothetical protein
MGDSGGLAQFLSVPYQLRRGRNVHEGYRRGACLENDHLRWMIETDPDYQDAMGFAENRTIVTAERLMNLFLLMKFFAPRLAFGHVIEFGSYRGGSAFFLGRLAARFLPGVQVFALDTFEGMPETDASVDAHQAGQFADISFDELLATKETFKLNNVHFVKGLFQESAPGLLEKARCIVLAHIDCDIYEAVGYAYKVSRPYMVPMAYYVFDDATAAACLGATEAVEDCVIRQDGLHAEQIFPHFVFRFPGLTKGRQDGF